MRLVPYLVLILFVKMNGTKFTDLSTNLMVTFPDGVSKMPLDSMVTDTTPMDKVELIS